MMKHMDQTTRKQADNASTHSVQNMRNVKEVKRLIQRIDLFWIECKQMI